MKVLLGIGAVLAGLAAAGAGAAAPGVLIHDAALQVTVIPEARSDVAVTIVKTNPRLPLKVMQVGDSVSIDGGLFGRSANCHSVFGRPSVLIWGVGHIARDDLPRIVIRTPMDSRVKAGGAVYGVVGRAASLDVDNSGCGDWTLADVAGTLRLHLAGSGDVRAGSAGSAVIHSSGSADLSTRAIGGGLEAWSAGSGDIRVQSVDGPLRLSVAGSSDVIVHAGAVTDMNVNVAGSGDVKFGGVAQTLRAFVAGSGDVLVGHVTGQVSQSVLGSGSVHVGS